MERTRSWRSSTSARQVRVPGWTDCRVWTSTRSSALSDRVLGWRKPCPCTATPNMVAAADGDLSPRGGGARAGLLPAAAGEARTRRSAALGHVRSPGYSWLRGCRPLALTRPKPGQTIAKRPSADLPLYLQMKGGGRPSEYATDV